MKKLVSDDRMRSEDDQPAAGVNFCRVRIRRVGTSHNFKPLLTNRVLGGVVTNSVFNQELPDQRT